MDAVLVSRFGDVDVLELHSVPTPVPGPGEVLIKVGACAVNRLDIRVRTGTWPGVKPPHIPGTELAGTITALGSGHHGLSEGDRVMVLTKISCGDCLYCRAGKEQICTATKTIGADVPGGYAEYVVVPARNCVRVPDHLSLIEAAAIPLTFVTAWHMLITRAGLKAGESVLILGAGSGIGVAALQIARHAGARVAATAGSAEKLAKARELGAELTLNHNEGGFADRVREWTNGLGVDVVFEHVGRATFTESLRSLSRGGRLVTCGATTGNPNEINLPWFYANEFSIIGSVQGTMTEFAAIARLVEQGVFKPVIDTTFPLAEAAAAQRRMEERSQFGKILLIP